MTKGTTMVGAAKSKTRFSRKDFARPKPSRLMMRLMGPINRWLILQGFPGLRRLPLVWKLPILRDLPNPGSTAKVLAVDFPESEIAKFKQYINPNTAAFIGPNHPEFFTDWSLDKHFADRVSFQMAHWAWYGTVNANPFMQGFWLRNNLISNAPNGKEEAKRHAIDWAKQGYGNLLHPEGSVNWTADKVQTIFGGIIDMSVRASQELIAAGDARPVYAVPMLSKYYFVEDVGSALAAEIGRIERKLGFTSDGRATLEDRFFSLQQRILAGRLSQFEAEFARDEITPQNFFAVQQRFQEELLARLRAVYGERPGNLPAQLRAYEKEIKLLRPAKDAPQDEAASRRYKEESKLVAEIRRLDTFQAEVYGTAMLSQEQIAETLKRTKRDLVNFTVMDGIRNMLPVAAGWRKVILRCGDPINVRERVEAHGGQTQELVDELLVEFRGRMQNKLDELIAVSKPVTDRFARANPFAVANVECCVAGARSATSHPLGLTR
jgi:hypothetical protein